ncbi:MAG: hypothetical protein PHP64_06100, partial [Actinomycetota bacterium]|nr:hypothetical protein [Actinomycetota bacterium]
MTKIHVNGRNATEWQDPFFVNGKMKFEFPDLCDDWKVTGTDPDGDDFMDGITTVVVRRSTNGAGYEQFYTLGTGPWKFEHDPGDVEGQTWSFEFGAYDTAGNGISRYSTQIYVDTIAPRTNLSTDTTPNKNGWRNKDTKVTLKTQDPNPDKIYYNVTKIGSAGSGEQSWKEYTGPFTLEHGEWEVSYYSVDKAGNKETPKKETLRIDTVPPEAYIIRPARDTIQTGYSSDDTFRISGNATDRNRIDKIELLWDGGKVSESTDQEIIRNGLAEIIDLEKVEDGYHTVRVKSTDIADNVTLTEKRVLVDEYASDWYFAEGNTLPDFQEYICLFNPGDEPANVTLTFMLETGENIIHRIFMSPRQRITRAVRELVPEGHPGVSLWVHTDEKSVIVERPMYFRYRRDVPGYDWNGGHICSGTNVLQKEWYFGEGTTRKNQADGFFETWLTVMNPNHEPARIEITYMLGTGQNIMKVYSAGPRSRLTVDVNGDVGQDQDVSMRVSSSLPVAVERPMYFDYHIFAKGGSAVSGISGPQSEWNFAEGCTRAGYQEWISVQNPNDVPANVSFTYFTGSGRMATSKHVIPSRSRHTINVATEAGDSEDVAAKLSSDVPIMAERPMYFIYGLERGSAWDGGDCVIGNPLPSTVYYLAEGTTIANFDTFYSLFNPREDKTATVDVEYVFGDGSTRKARYQILPHSRITLNVRDVTGMSSDVSASVVSSFPILIERPVYFGISGIPGGHTASGYGVD